MICPAPEQDLCGIYILIAALAGLLVGCLVTVRTSPD